MIKIPNTIQKVGGNFYIKMKSIPNTISKIPRPKFPVKRMVFLPNSFREIMAPKVAANWKKLIIRGV